VVLGDDSGGSGGVIGKRDRRFLKSAVGGSVVVVIVVVISVSHCERRIHITIRTVGESDGGEDAVLAVRHARADGVPWAATEEVPRCDSFGCEYFIHTIQIKSDLLNSNRRVYKNVEICTSDVKIVQRNGIGVVATGSNEDVGVFVVHAGLNERGVALPDDSQVLRKAYTIVRSFHAHRT